MELDTFVRHVVAKWYITLLLLIAAIGGTVVYHRITGEAKAVAVMAVLQPYVAAPGEYIPPAITLEAVDESTELADRVAARLGDGTTGADIRDKVSVDIQISTKPSFTPLYTASFRDRDEDRALAVNAIVVEEAIRLYAELNQPEATDVRTAFKPEVDRAEHEAAAARTALSEFEQANDAANLPARRDQIRGYIQQLQLIELQLQSGQLSSADLGVSLHAGARSELDRLSSIEGEYTRLKWNLDIATMDVARLQGRVSDLTLAAPTAEGVSPLLQQAQQEFHQATARHTRAQDALNDFRRTHNVSDVTASREAQLALVNQLSLGAASQQISTSTVGQELARQEAELRRLEGFESEYDNLALRWQRAETRLSTIEQRVLDIVGGQTLPAAAHVRLLGQPQIESNLFWLIVTYGLAILLAVFAAFTLIYLLAIFEPVRPTVPEIERRFDVPVLAHVPHGVPRDED
jgi:hypothetical protein